MKKMCSIFIVLIICTSSFFAAESNKQKSFEIGANIINQYPLGSFSEYAKSTLGCDFFVNYVLPKKLVKIENIGVNAAFGFANVFPNGNYVEKFTQNYFSFGAFYLINLPKSFQLKPQLNLGILNHKFVGGYEMKDNYSDFMIIAAFDARYFWKYNLIFNVSPVFTFVPVKDGVINYLGVKLGASYRF